MPKVNPRHVSRDVRYLLMARSLGLTQEYFGNRISGFKVTVLRGFKKNRIERRASELLGDIAVPTYFSSGIFNVQAAAQPHGLDGELILDFLFGRIEDCRLYDADHAFKRSDNYGVHEGRLKFLDYGNSAAVQLMLAYREQFRAALDEVYLLRQT